MVSKNHSKPVTRTPGPESFRFRSVVVAVQSFSSISCDDDGPCRSSSITIDDLESSPPSKRRDSLLLLHQAASTAELTNHLIHRRSSERKLATSCPPDVSFVYSKRGSEGRLATSVENVNEDEDLNSIDEATEENPEQAVTASSTLPSTLQIQRNAGEYTVIAFVNSASGGGEGKALLKCLQDHLGESFVIDLHSCGPGNMPEDSLVKYARDPMVRLLACGGDGTCGWILSSLDKVWSSICSDGEAKYKDHLPLAIMPLGTGNDLSRQYNWGGAFKLCMKDKSMIKSVEKAKLTYLDTWRCIIMPTHKLEEDEKRLIPHILGSSDHLDDDATSELLLSLLADGMLNESLSSKSSRKKLVSLPTTDVFDGSFCNYFSLGFDATIAYGFHRAREEHPERFKSRLTNQLFYIKESPHALRTPTLRKRIKVLVNNEQGQLVELNVPKRCRAIVSGCHLLFELVCHPSQALNPRFQTYPTNIKHT